MRIVTVVVAVTLLACAVTVALPHPKAWAESETPVGPASINMTSDQFFPNNPALVRAFIPTGSKSVKCLATMNETTFATMGSVFFCGERDSPIYGSGVMITILYPAPAPSNYGTSLTVWQAGAKQYGPPVGCTAAQIPDCL
jgi:hypothetical protein